MSRAISTESANNGQKGRKSARVNGREGGARSGRTRPTALCSANSSSDAGRACGSVAVVYAGVWLVGRARWKGGARPRELVRSAEGQLGGSDSLVWASGEMMAGKRVCRDDNRCFRVSDRRTELDSRANI
jgi:hypothetical protein